MLFVLIVEKMKIWIIWIMLMILMGIIIELFAIHVIQILQCMMNVIVMMRRRIIDYTSGIIYYTV